MNKQRQTQEAQIYRNRIEVLRNYAALDSFSVNEESEKDFWLFVGSISFPKKAGLALMDNGNLRAIWNGEGGSQLGLQFLGHQMVQYVIFKRCQVTGDVSRVAGRETLERIKSRIHAFDLTTLMEI